MNPTSRPSSLHVYQVMREALVALRPLLARIAKHDADLADELRRAAKSVLLNIGESEGLSPGRKRQHREIALGSLYEVRSAIDCAVLLGYVEEAEAADAAELAYRVGGMLYRLTH